MSTKAKVSTSPFAMALGIGTQNSKGDWLEVFFPKPEINPAVEEFAALGAAVGYTAGNQAITVPASAKSLLRKLGSPYQALASAARPLVAVLLATDVAPASIPELYLKLHLLSHRQVKPHGVNLTGIFKLLPNVAWTDRGAFDLSELPLRQLEARLKGETLEVHSVDKFPQMTDYVVPSGVRIADSARVRLGAYLGPGTTVMHAGFVNFNAGTAGPNMVEGRISSGVFVDEGSDLGGGCSTMGTLSGGNDKVLSIGKNCLIGANAGVGISLGDGCTIEAGLYVTASSKVRVVDAKGKAQKPVKALELSGKDNMLFRRNSQDGAIECLTTKQQVALNKDLHGNN